MFLNRKPLEPSSGEPDWIKEKKLLPEPSFEELRRARYEALPPALREIAEQADELEDYHHLRE